LIIKVCIEGRVKYRGARLRLGGRQRYDRHSDGEEKTRPHFYISPWVAADRSGLGSALCSRQTLDAETQTGLSPEMGIAVAFSPDFRLPREFGECQYS
jgi:hypothetical protein